MKHLWFSILAVFALACGAPIDEDEVPEWEGPYPIGEVEQEYSGGTFGGTVWGSRNDAQTGICTTTQAESDVCFFLKADQASVQEIPLYKLGVTSGFTTQEANDLLGILSTIATEIDTLAFAAAFIDTTIPCTSCNITLRPGNLVNPFPPTSNEIKNYGKGQWTGCTGDIAEPAGQPELGKWRGCTKHVIDIDLADIISKNGPGTAFQRTVNVITNRVLGGIGVGSTTGTGVTVGFRHRNFLAVPHPFSRLDNASKCLINSYHANGVPVISIAPNCF